MAIADLLLAELEEEGKKTRRTLERVPAAKKDFKPHEKSTSMGKLAAHLAQLGGFGVAILTTPQLDFATAGMKPLAFESVPQLLEKFDQGQGAVRQALGTVGDGAWNEPWKLCMGEQVFFAGSRFVAYRSMYANHIVHHRAQLGVYLRLLNVAVPSIYGPSADES
ncbi:MAG: DinB family protein [Terriglobales bacterium]